MANECAASVQLCAVRVARLDGTSGVPLPGADSLYVTEQFAQLAFNPEVSTGEDIEEKNGCGDIIVSYKTHDQERWWNVTLNLLTIDPELSEMLGGGTLLTLSGDNRGLKARPLRAADAPDEVSLELWTKRIVDGVQDDSFPYWRWVMPRVRNLRYNGEVTIGNGNVGPQFAGEAHENANWFDGPLNDWSTLSDVDADRAWNYVQDVAIPAAACGYQTLAAS